MSMSKLWKADHCCTVLNHVVAVPADVSYPINGGTKVDGYTTSTCTDVEGVGAVPNDAPINA